MYRVRAQNPDDNGTQSTDHVARVFERTRHGQDSRAQAGLQEVYQRVEIPVDRTKQQSLFTVRSDHISHI